MYYTAANEASRRSLYFYHRFGFVLQGVDRLEWSGKDLYTNGELRGD